MADAIETLATQVRLRGATLDIGRDADNESWTITINQNHYFCGHRGQKLSALANAINGKLKLSETDTSPMSLTERMGKGFNSIGKN